MNNKGFTLMELLATIVILSLVMGIASVGVTNAINNSKAKSEKLFVEKLSKSIDDYLDLYSSKLTSTGSSYTFNKCYDKTCTKTYQVSATELTSITLKDLVNKKLVDEQKLINPRNKKKCLDTGANPQIKIYKDSEYVYYYYVDLSGTNTSCEIEEENAIINTLPKNLVTALKANGVLIKEVGIE